MDPSPRLKSISQEYTLGSVQYKPEPYHPCTGEHENGFFKRHMEQLFAFFRLIPYPIQVFDGHGTAVMVNDSFLQMFGIDSAESYCGRFNILHDDISETPGARSAIDRVFKGEIAFLPCAYSIGYPNYSAEKTTRREKVFSSAVFIPVSGPDNRISHIISLRTDLTEQKKVEVQLRSSEETFRSMIHAIQEAALLIQTDGKVLAANSTVVHRLNETVDGIIGKNIYTLLPPEEEMLRKESIAKVMQTGKPLIGEIRREDRFLISSVNPVFNGDGKIERIAIFATDITRLKNAQEQIKTSEERMRALLEGSSDMVQVLDEKGTITYVSPSMEKILGYDPRQPLGDSAFRIIHPDDLPKIQQKFSELFVAPDKPLKVQCRCLHLNGSWRHIEAWAKNHLSNPAINGIVLNIRDITEHVQAQESIEASESKFRSIIEQSRDGVVIIDTTGTIIIFNKAQEQISGIPTDEALGKKIWDIQYRCMTDAHRSKMTYKNFKGVYRVFLETGTSPWLDKMLEVEMVRPDGRHIYLQTLLFALTINDAVVYASFNRDVTEQKNAEQELKKREAELQERSTLLQQKNIALRELMSQVESEKLRACEQFQTNIDQLVLPVLQRLKTRCCDADRVYVDMLEENLREVSEGFGLGLSSRMHHFTQREIELCGMIKQGMSSKEIGRLLNLSPRTVETHRNRIRRKLELADPKINLTTYLKSNMSSRNGFSTIGT